MSREASRRHRSTTPTYNLKELLPGYDAIDPSHVQGKHIGQILWDCMSVDSIAALNKQTDDICESDIVSGRAVSEVGQLEKARGHLGDQVKENHDWFKGYL